MPTMSLPLYWQFEPVPGAAKSDHDTCKHIGKRKNLALDVDCDAVVDQLHPRDGLAAADVRCLLERRAAVRRHAPLQRLHHLCVQMSSVARVDDLSLACRSFSSLTVADDQPALAPLLGSAPSQGDVSLQRQ